MSAKPNPAKIDADAPEADAAWFANARPASEVLPAILPAAIAEAALRPRGRPKAEAPKKLVSLRLDADVVDRLRKSGPGWQSRANEVLRKAVGI